MFEGAIHLQGNAASNQLINLVIQDKAPYLVWRGYFGILPSIIWLKKYRQLNANACSQHF